MEPGTVIWVGLLAAVMLLSGLMRMLPQKIVYRTGRVEIHPGNVRLGSVFIILAIALMLALALRLEWFTIPGVVL